MTEEGKLSLTRLYAAGKVNDKMVIEVASWFLPRLEGIAEQRFPDALMPVDETYGELLDLIYWCENADEVEAVAAAYFAACQQGA
jgi:hypothetical protein